MENETEPLNMEVLPNSSQAGMVEQMTRAEVDLQIATARKFGRPDLSVIEKRIKDIVCRTPEAAGTAFYTLRRKNKDGSTKLIQGPSIRLMEAAMSQYQHLRVDAQVAFVDTSGSEPHVVMVGTCHDLLNNVAVRQPNRRQIHTRWDKDKGARVVTEDAITLAVNSAASFAIRNAARRVIPESIISGAMAEAKRVAVGDARSLADRRVSMVTHFAQLGVDKERVLGSIKRASLDDVTGEDLANLIGIAAAIKDEQMTIDEAFPVETAPAPDIKMPQSQPATTDTAAPADPTPPAAKRKRAVAAPKAEEPTAPADPEPSQPMSSQPLAAPQPEPQDAPESTDSPERTKLLGHLMDIGATIHDLATALTSLNYHKTPHLAGCENWSSPAQVPEAIAQRLNRIWATVLNGEMVKVMARKG
jgi:hypothetical protein